MKRNSERILTTHVGSLPRRIDVFNELHAKASGLAYNEAELDRNVRDSVSDIVRAQVQAGLDIVNDGEHSKFTFASYVRSRLSGLEYVGGQAARPTSRDISAFPDVYRELSLMHNARSPETAARRGMMAFKRSSFTGPIAYIGGADIAADISNLKEASRAVSAEDVFMTAVSPCQLEGAHSNDYYRTEDEYLEALANAMNVEYRAIVDAGFVLQVDDPRLVTYYDRTPGTSIQDCRKFIARRVEALNFALKGIPRDRVRYHTCYSVNIAPRVHDMELKHYIDLIMGINAQAFSFEAANPRHEHEWEVWQNAKLPDDIILMPGVISHCIHLVEHPELVAQRIIRYANIVGRENVLPGNDCGFTSARGGDQVHPDIAWAKFDALAKGARIASAKLWH